MLGDQCTTPNMSPIEKMKGIPSHHGQLFGEKTITTSRNRWHAHGNFSRSWIAFPYGFCKNLIGILIRTSHEQIVKKWRTNLCKTNTYKVIATWLPKIDVQQGSPKQSEMIQKMILEWSPKVAPAWHPEVLTICSRKRFKWSENPLFWDHVVMIWGGGLKILLIWFGILFWNHLGSIRCDHYCDQFEMVWQAIWAILLKTFWWINLWHPTGAPWENEGHPITPWATHWRKNKKHFKEEMACPWQLLK